MMKPEANPYIRMSSRLLVLQELLTLFGILCAVTLACLLIANPFWRWVVLGGLFLLYLFFALLYFPIRFRNTGYHFTPDLFYFQTGFFIVKEMVIARNRLVYTSLYKNPFTPVFQIVTIVIRTTGGRIRLFGLSIAEGNRIIKNFSPNKQV